MWSCAFAVNVCKHGLVFARGWHRTAVLPGFWGRRPCLRKGAGVRRDQMFGSGLPSELERTANVMGVVRSWAWVVGPQHMRHCFGQIVNDGFCHPPVIMAGAQIISLSVVAWFASCEPSGAVSLSFFRLLRTARRNSLKPTEVGG